MFRFNMVFHFRFGDRLLAEATHFNVSAAVELMDGEISHRNILFAARDA